MKCDGLTPRQAEIAEYVARGASDKVIADRMDITIDGVRARIQAAASKVSGHGTPRHKLTLWFFNIVDEEKAG